jgi:uncharacterized protein YqjF (DUF2071 family)
MQVKMVGRLSKLTLLSYRTPIEDVQHLVPDGIDLLTQGSWAFWSVALCQVEKMRPAGVPALLGMTYRHVGYRLYVSAETRDHGTRDGLFFVRSEADRAWARWGGNLVTDFRFNPARVRVTDQGDSLSYLIDSAGQRSEIVTRVARGGLIAGSCFDTPEACEALLAYRPVGLAIRGREVRLATVDRREIDWVERPVAVTRARWAFFERVKQNRLTLERATRVAPIDYVWRIGQRLKRPDVSGRVQECAT